MGTIDERWHHSVSRRRALLSLAGMLAGSPLLRAQQDPRPLKEHKRVPGIDEMLTAFDFEPICFANLPRAAFDYMARGSESEFTLRRNREVFEWVDLVERPGASAAAVNTTSEMLGLKLDFPILVAPTARQRDLHPDAESAMYQGTTAAKTPMIVVGNSTIPIEKIAAAASGPRWSQFYPIQDLKLSREQLERFQAAGATGDRRHRRSADRCRRTSATCTTAISAGRPRPAGRARRRAGSTRADAGPGALPRPARRGFGTSGSISTTSGRSSRFRCCSKASSRPKTPGSASSADTTGSSSPTMAAARWTTVRRRSKYCRRSLMPWAARSP